MFYFRSEEKGLELLKAALPHLRLLTLPLDNLSRLDEYLSPSAKLDLNNVIFKGENHGSTTFCLKRHPRNKPQ